MGWQTFSKLAVVALVEVAEPDRGHVNLLFKFRKDGVFTYLETTGNWKGLRYNQQVELKVDKYRCDMGQGFENSPNGEEIPININICSANSNQVIINGKRNPKK